jgi:hypothetical protein
MRAQATHGDQEDRPHPLRRACPNRGNRISLHVKEERVSTPVRMSERIRGMKWKDYKEVSPEPKDYRGSDYSDDRRPSSWADARREDNDLYY